MSKSLSTQDPPLGIGLAAVIFASVGLALFFLPILSIPLAGVGLALGLLGLLLSLRAGRSELRWSIFGVALSALALGIGIAAAIFVTLM